MVYDPARMLHRRVHQRPLPLLVMLEVVRHNRDFELAVAFFKMGYPLRTCMQGVPWPQVRTRVYMMSLDIARGMEEFGLAQHIHWPRGGAAHIWLGGLEPGYCPICARDELRAP